MTSHSTSPQPTAFDPSQFDSESEDYDAMPSGTTAVLVLSALCAVPVLAVSLAVIPVAWAAQTIAGRGSRR